MGMVFGGVGLQGEDRGVEKLPLKHFRETPPTRSGFEKSLRDFLQPSRIGLYLLQLWNWSRTDRSTYLETYDDT